MKQIELHNGTHALVSDEDYEMLSQYHWSGYRYAYRSGGKGLGPEYMHRRIMNAPAGMEVDHINGNPLDNRRENLRLCTSSFNKANRAQTKGSSRFKGVRWKKDHNIWEARITYKRRGQHLGYFKDEVAAARAYDARALEVYGEFARLNNA